MEAAGLEEPGDDCRQMNVPVRFGQQGLDEFFGYPLAPALPIHAQGAELEAIGVRLEGHEANDPAPVVLGRPESIPFQAGVVEIQAFRQYYNRGEIGRSGFPHAHFRSLYHAPDSPRSGQSDPENLDSPRLGK